MRKIGISAAAAMSAIGNDFDQDFGSTSAIKWWAEMNAWAAPINAKAKQEMLEFRQQHRQFRNVDPSVIMAILTAEKALQATNWQPEEGFGIQIGSSRGATSLWEQSHHVHLGGGKLPAITSPFTTLGNLSTNVARYLGHKGWTSEQSITCSTALHACVQAIAFIRAEMMDKFVVGGTEAPLTSFTFRQMDALRISPSTMTDMTFPARPFGYNENTGMVLGEGAACFCLELEPKQPMAWIMGIGYAQEQYNTATGIDEAGQGFQDAMRMAIGGASIEEIDLVLAHAPGTKKGDAAEYQAINNLFGDKPPMVFSNKWQIGHCLGASGALTIFQALSIFQEEGKLVWPYQLHYKLGGNLSDLSEIKRILINATGFGGNVVSILLAKP